MNDSVVADMYRGGASVRQIAGELGVSLGSVYLSLERSGIQRKSLVFPLETMRAVVDEYNTERYTMAQVAKRFGVSESVVYKWVHLDRAGELGVVKERVKRGSSFDTERMVELYRDGVGIRSIAAEVGCSASAVKCHLLSADVYEGSERGTSRKIKLTEDVRKKILDDYNSKIISMQELSSKYDVTASSIRRVLRDFGIMNPFGKGKGVHKSSLKYTLSDSVISDYETGLYTHKNLSRKYGVSTRTISIILSAAGLKAIGMIPHTPSHVVAQLRGGVLAALAEGKTVYEVAELHKIPVDTVERIAGGGKESEDSVTETPVGMGDGVEDKIVSLHEGGRKMTEIAGELGLTVYAVRKVLVGRGLGTRMVHVEKPSSGTKSDRVRDDVLASHEEGLAVADIAARCGVSAPTVRKILREAGVVPHKQCL